MKLFEKKQTFIKLIQGLLLQVNQSINQILQRLWHHIYTKPHQEKVALDNLTYQNYQCYLPLINTEKILRGKKILSKEPMFPGYLFVRLSHDGQQNWSPIPSTIGVSHF
jgi:transcription antitermination factor NusG